MNFTRKPFLAVATVAALPLILATCAQAPQRTEEPEAPKVVQAEADAPQVFQAAAAVPAKLAPAPGCQVMTTPAQQNSLLRAARTIQDPPVYDFTANPGLVADMKVEFANPTLAGCRTKLRQYAGELYDGRPVGPTMLIRPGQAYQADINNQLPREKMQEMLMSSGMKFFDEFGGHGGNSTMFGYVAPERTHVNMNTPHGFNTTNLHTHGWHVSPIENSDNIFAAIEPGDPVYRQLVRLPADHPAGTFWYHAHLHGSTALQVASGMVGALIVDDPTKGLDAIPQIAGATDRIFVLQQLGYNEQGVVDEKYTNMDQGGYCEINRPVFVNGLVYPTIAVKVDEVQRWRFIHAGITNGINPKIVKSPGDETAALPMYEIALDGLPTGEQLKIENATLSPGYRVDVLAQFSNVRVGDTLYLIDSSQEPRVKCSDDTPEWQNMRYILAQIKVVAGTPDVKKLPSAQQIAKAKADYVYGSYNPDSKDPYADIGPLNDVADDEITGKTQIAHYFRTDTYTCPEVGGSCTPCPGGSKCSPNANFMFCDGKDQNNQWMCMTFNNSADYARTLALDTASKWQVSGNLGGGNNSEGQQNHIFHIHVNPFQVQRKYVDGSTGGLGDKWVWKDTLKTPVVANTGGEAATLKTRYTVFTGAFVQHCHVLHHEDRGMMQVVEIRPSDGDISEMMEKMAPDAFEQMILKQLKH